MELSEKRCQACEGEVVPLSREEAMRYMPKLDDWALSDDATTITKTFRFKGFFRTMAFMNAIAWVAQNENHHPDCEISYNKCTVHFTTHAISGLSENDFICAAKVDKVFKGH